MEEKIKKISLYVSSVSSNNELKKRQKRIQDILESKYIDHEIIDISLHEANKERMRELCGNPTALPPQIFQGDKYLGDYTAFDEAVEEERMNEFLQL